jgi:ribosomal protein S11
MYEDLGLKEWELEKHKKDSDLKEVSLRIKKIADELKEKKLELRVKKRQERKIRSEISKKARIYEILLPSNFSKVLLPNEKFVSYYTKKRHNENFEESEEFFEDKSNEADSEQVEYVNSTSIKERAFTKEKKRKKTLTIRIKPNNVFCTLKNEINNKVISGSSTKYKIKMSKKTLRYNYKIVVRSFLGETKKMLKSSFVLVCITAPKRIRRELLRILRKNLLSKRKSLLKNVNNKKKRNFGAVIFNFRAKKCFNGCRAKKKRRNKQRGLRIYK